MAEVELFQPRRFRSAARHYLAGRPAYAPRLIRHVAGFTRLAPDHRILDLGCGPGMLAGAFAPLVGEVIAMDPEPEMLRIAEAEFGGAGRISFVRGSSFDLSPTLGRFHLVTMGRSFQWMDRAETLRRLDGMIEPGGAVVLFNNRHRDAPEMEWIEPYRALVRRYAASDQTHVKRRSDAWVDHEVVLLDSAFSVLDEIAVIERRQTSVEQLVERALSRSSTTEERLGTAASRFAAEIQALLRPLATDGLLTEVVATYALIARRPAGEEQEQKQGSPPPLAGGGWGEGEPPPP
jgi:ubiquinone/menaquinone biosynthesis C-methylase UbiE